MLPPLEGEEVHALLKFPPPPPPPLRSAADSGTVVEGGDAKISGGETEARGGWRWKNIRDLGSPVMFPLIAARFGGCGSCCGHPTRTHIPPHPSGFVPGGCSGVTGEMARPRRGSTAATRGDSAGAGSVIQPGLQSEQQLTVPGCNCHRQVMALSPRQLFGASVFRAGQVPAAGTAG